ncbi:C39 family peptidase [Oribacterium sp. WCC10]|uniref:C39 family peptidase n=1 Tax=Oribacterium sp. WCC10 TaxID=1855343 RepID=UPI0008EEB354|nr:C39 family peptidase [Oribacterium sp. WCC10]SFG71000.1 Peptidase_C39 like family protein [Oribacterium sp. WCC10]
MKKAAKITGIILAVLVAIPLVLLLIVSIRTTLTQDDYSAVYTNPKYQNPVKVADVEVIQQHISCGYAVIEMFSAWNGGNVTEDSLFDEYGTVVTSSGNNFCKEMNKQFPEYTTTMHKYVKNTEFIDIMYDTLESGKPVPFEWAAMYGDEWTLHYSLIVGADIPNDTITVANPYGYYEVLTPEELLERTSFRAYEHMPLFMRMGFAIGLFEKNTLYSVE